MNEMTVQLTETGAFNVVASYKPPPPPVLPRSVYLRCTSDGASISALSLIIPSLSDGNARRLATALRKAADKLEAKEVSAQAGTRDDPGIVIDMLPVMSK